MADKSQTNPGSSDDNTMMMLCVFTVLIAAGFYMALPYLKQFWLVYVQVEGYLTNALAFTKEIKDQSKLLLEWAQHGDMNDVTAQKFSKIRNNILFYGVHNFIISGMLLISVFFIIRKWSRYEGIPSIESLLSTEYKVWPTLEFVKRFNPYDHWSELKGIGRYMLSPFVFSVENGILEHYKKKSKHDRRFNFKRAEEVGENILGDEFVSYKGLKPIYKVLVALVVAKELSSTETNPKKGFVQYDDLSRFFSIELADVKQPRSSLDDYLNTILDPLMAVLDGEKKFGKSKLNLINTIISWLEIEDTKFSKINEKDVYANKLSTKSRFIKYKNQYGYVKTIVIGMSREVKRKGKFPPGRLLFFKPWDRELFMILSNVPYYSKDRPYHFVKGQSSEVMPVFAHYQHESFAKRKLERPYIGTFVTGLHAELVKKNLISGES